jgi:flagellar capping protein FliD
MRIPLGWLSLDSQIELNNDRVEQLSELLDAKRLRLQAEFNAMEQTLALLQRQSTAIAGIQNLSSSSSSLF